jgi:2-C-methyl-D-erythritol 4-phosphate cytidylyltransferase
MTISHPKVSAILLAGGKGLRMHASTPKQFLLMRGKPLALYSFETLCAYPGIEEVVVVCDPAYHSIFIPPTSVSIKFASPGERRQDSVFNGLKCISKNSQLVCVHDSARPFLNYEDMISVIRTAEKCGAATLAAPVKNTIKESDGNAFATRTLERSYLWEIYTPQVMIPSHLIEGFEIVNAQNITVTDDMSIVELAGYPVKLVKGLSASIKITTPEDFSFAQVLLEQRASQ